MTSHEHKHRNVPITGGEHEPPIVHDDVESKEAAMPPDELENAKAEVKEFQDKYLRLCADTENYKKRMARDSAEREKFHNEAIIKELLPVLDNLERALSHAGESEDTAGGIVEGVKMVMKQLTDALVKFGVTPVAEAGQPFDPNREQAIMQVETAEYEPGMVVAVVQKGYMLNDRLLRPAMVTVSKRPEGE